MAVGIDAVGIPFTGGATTGFTDSSLTIGPAANALVVMIEWGGIITSPILNWNSTVYPQTMTSIGLKAATDSLSVSYLFGLLLPAAGNWTFSANWTGSNTYAGNTMSVTGADLTSFATTFKNLVTLASTTGAQGLYPAAGEAITTNPGDLAIMTVGSGNQTLSQGGGLGTEIIGLNTNVSGAGRYRIATSPSTLLAANATFSSGSPCSLVGCAITAGPPATSLQAQICLNEAYDAEATRGLSPYRPQQQPWRSSRHGARSWLSGSSSWRRAAL